MSRSQSQSHSLSLTSPPGLEFSTLREVGPSKVRPASRVFLFPPPSYCPEKEWWSYPQRRSCLRAIPSPGWRKILLINFPPPNPEGILAEKIDLAIIYEDPDLIVVNKPAGMLVHPFASTAPEPCAA